MRQGYCPLIKMDEPPNPQKVNLVLSPQEQAKAKRVQHSKMIGRAMGDCAVLKEKKPEADRPKGKAQPPGGFFKIKDAKPLCVLECFEVPKYIVNKM